MGESSQHGADDCRLEGVVNCGVAPLHEGWDLADRRPPSLEGQPHPLLPILDLQPLWVLHIGRQ